MGNKLKGSSGIALLAEKAKLALVPPSMYQVLLNNDDYTPMAFVIEVLERFFGMDPERAMRTMLQVHHHGKAVCGLYTQDVAETKVVQINDFSRQHGHPLLCFMQRLE